MGHPDTDSLTAAFADHYEQGALAAGHEVRRMNLGDMHFDPILHKGYKVIQELEPDLESFQENVRWADHLVMLYPNWWGTMPALLKGLLDRAWLPGFAFRMRKDGVGWHKLLSGKTARVVILANSNPMLAYALFGDFTNELERATLAFSGIRSRCHVFSPSEKASEKKLKRWFKQMERLGARAA